MIASCPFCGDDDPAIDEIRPQWWAIVCNGCEAIGPAHVTAEGAIRLWDARAIAAGAAKEDDRG